MLQERTRFQGTGRLCVESVPHADASRVHDAGEDPLPGNQMTAEECKKYGLPVGSLWLDEVRSRNPKPHTVNTLNPKP